MKESRFKSDRHAPESQIAMRGGTATFTIRVRVMPDGKVFIEKPSGTKGPTVPLPDLATAGAWLMDTLAAAYGASRKAKRLAAKRE